MLGFLRKISICLSLALPTTALADKADTSLLSKIAAIQEAEIQGLKKQLQMNQGVTDGSRACAGCIGEVVCEFTPTVYVPHSNNRVDILSIQLTPGDWDISAQGTLFAGNGTTFSQGTNGIIGISSTNAEFDAPYFHYIASLASPGNEVAVHTFAIPQHSVSTKETQTFTLNGTAVYEGASPWFRAKLCARRQR